MYLYYRVHVHVDTVSGDKGIGCVFVWKVWRGRV